MPDNAAKAVGEMRTKWSQCQPKLHLQAMP